MSNRELKIGMSSGSEQKADLNDIIMIFRNPKSGVKPEVNIASEINQDEDTHKTKERDSDRTRSRSAQPALAAPYDQNNLTVPGHKLNEVDDHSKESFSNIDDESLEPIDNQHDSTTKEGPEGSHYSHGSPDPTHEGVDTEDGKWWPSSAQGDYPNSPGDPNSLESRFGIDGPPIPPPSSTPDVNAYQQRKNLAHGMMDLALLSANANQLRYIIESSSHPYYYAGVTFVSLSIILQVAVGILLILNSQYDVTSKKEICKAIRVNNITVVGVFLITIINVFVASFSVAPAPALTLAPSGNAAVQQAP